jgi:hypothetical protein
MAPQQIESIELAWVMAQAEDPYRHMARWILGNEPPERHYIAELAIKVGEAEAHEVGQDWLDTNSKILAGHKIKYEPNKGHEHPDFVRIERIDFIDFAARLYPNKPEKVRNIKAGRAWEGLVRVYYGYFLADPNTMKGNQLPPQLSRLPLAFLYPPKKATDDAGGLDFESLAEFIAVYDEDSKAKPGLSPNAILGFDFANERIEFLRAFVEYKKQQLEAWVNRRPAG